jgi:DNA-binding response OmpR family regulator
LMFRTTLESTGETTAEAEDGEAALALLAESSFDLVLLDLQMPGIDGMETLRRLRAGGDETPVVIVTAHGSVPHAVEAMRLGAIDFLTKPLTPEALRHVVTDVCARGRVASPANSGRRDEPVTVVGEFVANLARAKIAINRREFTPAEVYLTQALALHDGSAEAHNLMGVLRELRNDHDGSYKSYRASLRVDPTFEPAKHNMTRYYERFTFGASNVPVDTGEGTVG